MADRSVIEWTDATWNPIRARNLKTGKVGWYCEHATTGCEFCYAEGFNLRLGTGLPFKPGHRKDVEIFLDEEMLTQPLRWKKPRMIFVCSMTDLFADFVPDEMLDRIFATIGFTDEHTYQILSKRSARMRAYMSDPQTPDRIDAMMREMALRQQWCRGELEAWPPKNVWLGVSAERQDEAVLRIVDLLNTPAAIRFVSAEPLLGAIDLTRLCILPQKPGSIRAGIHVDALRGKYCESGLAYTGQWDISGPTPPASDRRKIDWLIAGGESGRGARPMSIQWARELRDQCRAAGTAFFFKQWGEWKPAGAHRSEDPGRFAFGDYEHDRSAMIQVDGYPRQFTKFGARSVMERVGKAKAGRLLDGVEHNGMPVRR